MKTVLTASLIIGAGYSTAAQADGKFSYPTTRKETNIERHFGTVYSDPFRWMENLHDPDLTKWTEEQNNLTKRYVDGNTYRQLQREFRELFAESKNKNLQTGDLNGHKHRRFIERIKPGSTLDSGFDGTLSPDGKYKIWLHSDSGSDLKVLTIEELSSGTFLSDVLKVKFADFIWDDTGESFLYSGDRDGRTGYHIPQIRRHKLGQKQSEDKVLFTAPGPDTWISLIKISDRFLLYQSRENKNRWDDFDPESGTRGELFISSTFEITPVTYYENEVYFLSYENAPNGKIIAVDRETKKRRIIVSEQDLAIDRVSRTGADLFITFVENTSNVLYHLDISKMTFKRVKFSETGSLVPSERDGKPYFYFTSYTQPSSGWSFNRTGNTLTPDQEAEPSPLDLEAFRTYYRSVTGQKTPIWIVKQKATSLGRHTPVYLYGYGGFRINIMPGFVKQYLPWLKRGGAIAVATLPGGLEFGENWHQAGALRNKMNVFHDFARAGKHLIRNGMTSRSRLAIGGGSNGGLLVAATLNEYPGLFKAAVPEVGVLDMTRFELYTGGKWWTSEYGSRKDRRQFKNLMRISPYHNIRSARYPDILTMTADLDDRVVASHSYKYTAMLQAWNFRHQISLLYTKRNGSHSSRSGTDAERTNYYASKWAFLLKSLSVN